MALIRPTLSGLVELIRSDGDALLGGVDARLERSLVEVVLLASAGALHGAYGYLQQIADDLFPDSATAQALERLASIFGISRGPATFARGWVHSPSGSFTFPVGSIVRRADGVEFELIASGPLPDGTELPSLPSGIPAFVLGLVGGFIWAVQAVESGTDGNTLAGATLSLVVPIAGAPATVTSGIGISGGTEFESDELLRARLLARYRNPPQGGTAAEYKAWALSASTDGDPVTGAFVVPPASGSNVVLVYVIDDGGTIPTAKPPAPSAQAILNVEAAIDENRPLSADRNVLAPTFVAITPTIALSPDTPETRLAIENEIETFLIDNHEPGLEVAISLLQAIVSNAAGGADAQITAPTSNYTPAPDEYLYRGAINWV